MGILNGQAATVGYCLHRFAFSLDVAGEHLCELVDIVPEVGQKDVVAEVFDRHPGVARQPVFGDLLTVNHGHLSKQ